MNGAVRKSSYGRRHVSPVTHFFTGWVLADSVPSLSPRERMLITLAGVVPDVDGLGAIPDLLTRHSAQPLDWFSRYHHQLHNLAFALVVAAVAFTLAKNRWLTGALALVSFHVHLFEDLIGARGPDGYPWPIPYLSPFSHAAELTWSGQWALNAWPNFAITLALLFFTFYFAWSRGYSPLEMISARADQAFVAALRRRFPR
jgi:inner membrane protein